MHGLIRQMSETVPQACDHPSGEIDIGAVQRPFLAFNRPHHLLCMEPRPTAQRLGKLRAIGVIGRHIFTHDARHRLGNIEMSLKRVLRFKLRKRFKVNTGRCPVRVPVF